MITRTGASLLALALVLSSAPASAQISPREEQARADFERGRQAFEDGQFEVALEAFQSAYENAPRPLLLYNVGQAADRLRRDAVALDAFERYIAAVGPSDPHYVNVQARIEVLRASVAGSDGGSEGEGPGQGEGAGPAEQSGAGAGDGGGSVNVVPWIIAAVGVALVGGGVPMVVVAGADADAVNNAPPGSVWADYEGAANGAEGLSLAGQVMIFVGAAAVAGGAIWGIIDLASGGGSDVALHIHPNGLALSGSFQ